MKSVSEENNETLIGRISVRFAAVETTEHYMRCRISESVWNVG